MRRRADAFEQKNRARPKPGGAREKMTVSARRPSAVIHRDTPSSIQDGRASAQPNSANITALRQFEDDLDRLIDELLMTIGDFLPSRFIELAGDNPDSESPRDVGKKVTVRGVVVDDLHECVDEAFLEFDWPLKRALRRLREALQ
jgi:hypothetical protein